MTTPENPDFLPGQEVGRIGDMWWRMGFDPREMSGSVNQREFDCVLGIGPEDESVRVRAEVDALDPELLAREDTRVLIELGASVGQEVTSAFGTPSNPKWASVHTKQM